MKISTGFLLASVSVVQGFSSSSLSLRPLAVNHVPSASVAPSHSWSPSSKLFAETQMNTEVIDESLREEDPIEFIAQEVQVMDVNAIINTAIIVLVAIAVLNQVATVDSGLMRGWTTEETLLRMPIDNWNSYSDILAQAPLQTKAVTSATVYTIGDFIAQRTEGRDIGQLDRPRLIRSLLAGLIGHGPLSHIWYDVSEDLFENVLHLKDWWGTVVKVVIDQTTWGPFWNNTYILLLGLMKMDKLENIFGEMKRTTIPLIVSGLKLWPLAHCVTYGLVPVENRLLWVDLVEIIWVTILATAAAGGSDGEEKEGLH
jgi:protein Mpv17